MNIFIRLLKLVLLVECATVAWSAWSYSRQHQPTLPQVQHDDPFLAADLNRLAKQTETGTSSAWQTLGEALLGNGFYGEAEIAFRTAVDIDSRNATAQFALGFLLDRTGRMAESSSAYRRAAEIASRSNNTKVSAPLCHYLTGKNLLRLGQTEDALKQFQKHQTFPPATYQLAKLSARTGQTQQALDVIDSILERAPTSLKFNSLKLHVMEETGNDKAVFQAARRLDYSENLVETDVSTSYVTPFNQAYGFPKLLDEYNQLLRSGDMNRIAAKLRKLLDEIADTATPHRTRLLQGLAEAEFQRGNLDGLQRAVDELKSLGVSSADCLQMEGAAYALRDDMTTAAQLWERACLLSPNIPLHQMLARHYGDTDNESRQTFHANQAALLIAKTAYWSRQPAAAQNAIDEALQIKPNDPECWLYKAKIALAMDDIEAARTAYTRCLKSGPYQGRAKRALQALNSTE